MTRTWGISSMGCTELRRLLMHTDWRESESSSSCIASHIRTCPHCRRGLVHLSRAIITDDPLSCEQSRARFPDYYEATRAEYPLVEIANEEMAQMAYHLSHCASCNREYRELALLSELEERNEMLE